MTPEMRFTLHDDKEYGANWSGYPYIKEPVVRVMNGIWDGHLEAGDQVTLFTLLHASGEEASPLHLTRLGPNAAAVSGEGAEPAIVAVGGTEGTIPLLTEASARAQAALVMPGRLALFDASEIEYQGQSMYFGNGQDVSLALGDGDVLVCATAGRTAQPDETQFHDYQPELATFADDMVRALISQVIATAPPREAGKLPHNQQRRGLRGRGRRPADEL